MKLINDQFLRTIEPDGRFVQPDQLTPSRPRCRRCGRVLRTRRSRLWTPTRPALMNAGNLIQVQPDHSISVARNDDGTDGIVIAGDDDPCCCKAPNISGNCSACPAPGAPRDLKFSINGSCPPCKGAGEDYSSMLKSGSGVATNISSCMWQMQIFGGTFRTWSNANCSGTITFSGGGQIFGFIWRSGGKWYASAQTSGFPVGGASNIMNAQIGSAFGTATSNCQDPFTITDANGNTVHGVP